MSAWKDIVTAALIGGDQGGSPPLPAELSALTATVAEAPQEKLLTNAGAYALWRKAGRRLVAGTARPEAAPAETAPLLSPASAGQLRRLLDAKEYELMAEWLELAKTLGRRVPPELLPALFKAAKQRKELVPLVVAVGGERGAWLAVQHPDGKDLRPLTSDLWDTGTLSQRVALLQNWRETNPSFGRAQLEKDWAKEGSRDVVDFMETFRSGLSAADEPFLERCLEAKHVQVRGRAVDYLSSLPDSALIRRATERADAMLAFKPGRLLGRASMDVNLPESPDTAAVRDGLDPALLPQTRGLGKRAVLLFLLLGTVPPRHWSERFAQTPEAILKALEKNEFAKAIVAGFALAACRQKDAAWARALLDGPISFNDELLEGHHLLEPLPVPEATERLTQTICQDRAKIHDAAEWHHLLNFKARALPRYFPEKHGREILAYLRQAAAKGFPWQFTSTARLIFPRLPLSLLAETTEGWPVESDGVAKLVELAHLRREALQPLLQESPAPKSTQPN